VRHGPRRLYLETRIWDRCHDIDGRRPEHVGTTGHRLLPHGRWFAKTRFLTTDWWISPHVLLIGCKILRVTTPDPNASAVPSTQEDEPRMELIRWSYAEVLDATMHQDDKIGRFLTAIAFLTTGGIALLFRSDLLAAEVSFGGAQVPGHGHYPLLAAAALLFVACVISAVVLLLQSLSAPLRMPGSQAGYGHPLDGSRLFFSYIGNASADDWLESWKTPTVGTIRHQMYGQYVNETHNLSERARLKYQHTREASTLFILGLVFLAAGIFLAAFASRYGLGHGQHPRPYDHLLGAALGSVFAGHAWLQLHAILKDQQLSTQLRRDAKKGVEKALRLWGGAQSLDWLLITIPVFTLALTLPSNRAWERFLGVFMVCGAVTASLLLTRQRWLPKTGLGRQQKVQLAKYVVVPGVAAVVALIVGGVWPLCVAAGVPVGLSSLTVRRPGSSALGRTWRTVSGAMQTALKNR